MAYRGKRMLVITSEMWDAVVDGKLPQTWWSAGLTIRDQWLFNFNTCFNPNPPWALEDLAWFVSQISRADIHRPCNPKFVSIEYREDPVAATALQDGGHITGNNFFMGSKEASEVIKHLTKVGAVANGKKFSDSCSFCLRDIDNGEHITDDCHFHNGAHIIADRPGKRRKKRHVTVEDSDSDDDTDNVQKAAEVLGPDILDDIRQRLRAVEAEHALRDRERNGNKGGQNNSNSDGPPWKRKNNWQSTCGP